MKLSCLVLRCVSSRTLRAGEKGRCGRRLSASAAHRGSAAGLSGSLQGQQGRVRPRQDSDADVPDQERAPPHL